jgi:hypothetical protein
MPMAVRPRPRRTHSQATFAVPQKSSRRLLARRPRSWRKVSSTKSISVSAHCTEANLDHYLDSLEPQRITGALAQTRDNKTGAARLLGITLRRPALPPRKARDGGLRQGHARGSEPEPRPYSIRPEQALIRALLYGLVPRPQICHA